MTRNLKALCLAFVAVLGLCAVAASVASADAFTAEAYPVTRTGARPAGVSPEKITTTAGAIECSEATYHGTMVAATSGMLMNPSFNGPKDSCTGGGFPAIVDTNGCEFRFNINGGVLTTGTMDIFCPAGKDITVTFGQNTAGTATTKCTIHIPEQMGINGINYSIAGTGATREVVAEINANNLNYTHTSGSGLGACVGAGAVEQKNGTFVGKVAIKAETDPGGGHVGLFMSNL